MNVSSLIFLVCSVNFLPQNVKTGIKSFIHSFKKKKKKRCIKKPRMKMPIAIKIPIIVIIMTNQKEN